MYPNARYIAIAIEAASQRAALHGVKFDTFDLRDITIGPLLIVLETEAGITITSRPYQEGRRTSSTVWDEFIAYSWATERGWMKHCNGLIVVRMEKESNDIDGPRRIHESEAVLGDIVCQVDKVCKSIVDKEKMYRLLEGLGANYGPSFQGFESCLACTNHVVADIVVPGTAATMPMGHEPDVIIHPAVLEQLLQMYLPIFYAGHTSIHTIYTQLFIGKMSISCGVSAAVKNPGSRLRPYCSGNPSLSNEKPTHIARWMITKGARNIVLVLRTGSVNNKIAQLINELATYGANIVVCRCNVSNKTEVEKLIAEDLAGMPMVRGVIHGAMVLHASNSLSLLQ